MTTATENTVQAPSQTALDNIVETMAALLDEALAITGCEPGRGGIQLNLSSMPSAVWHALDGDIRTSESYTWKHLATRKTAGISGFCEHNGNCPSRAADGTTDV